MTSIATKCGRLIEVIQITVTEFNPFRFSFLEAQSPGRATVALANACFAITVDTWSFFTGSVAADVAVASAAFAGYDENSGDKAWRGCLKSLLLFQCLAYCHFKLTVRLGHESFSFSNQSSSPLPNFPLPFFSGGLFTIGRKQRAISY